MISTQEAGKTWTEWCGQLPAAWTAMELRRVADISASNVDKLSQEGEIAVRLCNYTEVYYNDVITPDLEFMEATASRSEIARFRLIGGEVLLTKDSETAEDIAIPAYVMAGLEDVVCGYHLYLLRPQADKLDGRFLMRACSVSPVRDQFVTAANGITRFGLGQQDLGCSLVPVPPLHVQRNVADFLDRETARIDHLIEEKQRLIDLLEEKRTALITQAVTKGLDPGVEMKDSGVEWLGEIPANWAAMELRFLVRRAAPITYGIVQAGPDIPDGIPYIRTGDMSGEELPKEGYKRTSEEIDRAYRRSRVAAHDVVVAIRATVGKALQVPDFLEGANLTQGTARVAPGSRVRSRFLFYAISSSRSQQRFEALSKGATFREITLGMLRRFRVAVPPLHDQDEIVEYLDESLAELTSVIVSVRQAITLLREYRSALISAAVTGKIDVREEAA